MHIHILGICGTFMGSLAILARELGHVVTGSDTAVYPPMSTQLEAQGIRLQEGYHPEHLEPAPDLVIIGNALSRGNAAVEYVLERGLPYVSGPQWLADHVLQGRWVLACAGTHGKTTTSSLLTWLLEANGYNPGYLIGGVPENFAVSARLTDSNFFVIEADEYDCAFFDKRSKFVHYRPRTAVLNNLEFDHADIFPNLEAIQRQFHHLVRTIPASGKIISPSADTALGEVLAMGCWSERESTGLSSDAADWQAQLVAADGSCFDVLLRGQPQGRVTWRHTGLHNVQNALSAIAAAHHVGVRAADAIAACADFAGVKRRMELLANIRGIHVYDDFAHHPTAIATTLEGLRARVGSAPIVAVIEPRSNTMRMGLHLQRLAPATNAADRVLWYQPAGLDWSLDDVIANSERPALLYNDIERIVADLTRDLSGGEHIVVMSNGGFGGIHQKLVSSLLHRFGGAQQQQQQQ
ncbi:MAG TPA: UDP-N-acetylmuramate:L-alanyl-gamma-D-glutamyl-meso-diaminopimelate ligase [Spongiibacteraceae bacterium]|nr:UDP-N-acetylmuramate:L-alanyl-gamma-D-glutamyl-meso-diaminopimelate ligase [Spongiibacteraceae bacterium]